MGRYRIRKSLVQYLEPLDHRPGLVRLEATADGLALKQVRWKDLVVSTFGRLATILLSLRDDPADPAFVICETRDIILDATPDEPLG
jgi:hypothetical protein